MKPVLEIIGTISHYRGVLHAGLRGLGIANKSRDVDPAASVMKRMHYVTLTNCRCPVWAGRVAGYAKTFQFLGTAAKPVAKRRPESLSNKWHLSRAKRRCTGSPSEKVG